MIIQAFEHWFWSRGRSDSYCGVVGVTMVLMELVERTYKYY
jgi:hypothetical protein